MPLAGWALPEAETFTITVKGVLLPPTESTAWSTNERNVTVSLWSDSRDPNMSFNDSTGYAFNDKPEASLKKVYAAVVGVPRTISFDATAWKEGWLRSDRTSGVISFKAICPTPAIQLTTEIDNSRNRTYQVSCPTCPGGALLHLVAAGIPDATSAVVSADTLQYLHSVVGQPQTVSLSAITLNGGMCFSVYAFCRVHVLNVSIGSGWLDSDVTTISASIRGIVFTPTWTQTWASDESSVTITISVQLSSTDVQFNIHFSDNQNYTSTSSQPTLTVTYSKTLGVARDITFSAYGQQSGWLQSDALVGSIHLVAATHAPTRAPTQSPTSNPTGYPTRSPTPPTKAPTHANKSPNDTPNTATVGLTILVTICWI